MKGFFANLIDRHQGMAETVAPRAHSYFEEGTRPVKSEMGDLSRTTVQEEQNQPADSIPSRTAPLPEWRDQGDLETNGQIAPPQRLSIASSDANTSHSLDRESMNVTPALAKKGDLIRSEPETGWNSNLTGSSYGAEHANDPVYQTEIPTPPDSASTLETNQRIDAVLNRLHGQMKLQTGDESPNASQGSLERLHVDPISARVKTNTSADLLQDGLAPPGSMGLTETSDRNVEPEHAGSQSNLNRGDLEVPAWLKQRQTEFSLKNTETSRTSEPIINVTIGRVEVKAQHEPKPKTRSSRAKPSGVMSLDEYLSQRQRKGVV